MTTTGGLLADDEREFVADAHARAQRANDEHDRQGDLGLVSVLTAAGRPAATDAAHSAAMTSENETPKPAHRYVKTHITGRIGRVLYEDPRTGLLAVETMTVGKVVTDTYFWSPLTVTAIDDIAALDNTRKLIDEAANIKSGDKTDDDNGENYTRRELVELIQELGTALAATHTRAVTAEQAGR